ncbi:hypothetical protein [Legionella tunisiensis]|uniref:hypothetical protein n=1 Tax=Legionella tunisiensis TaxID=1034944 RepID=UPI00030A0FF1|nr:hypothetical protein [Legionella tunisiensis]
MKNKLIPILVSVPLITMVPEGAMALVAKQNNQVKTSNQQVTLDPDSFFQSPNDILKHRMQMQRAIDQFMKDRFSQMQQPGGANTVEIKESKNEIIYQINYQKMLIVKSMSLLKRVN